MKQRQYGIVVLDILAGLMLLGALATVLAVATARQGKANHIMQAQRQADRAAERMLIALQTASEVDAPEAISGKSAPIKSAAPPEGFHWVVIKATADGRASSLIGLVPTHDGEAR